jgi:hypothetical protein
MCTAGCEAAAARINEAKFGICRGGRLIPRMSLRSCGLLARYPFPWWPMLSGQQRTLRKGESRLFEPMHNIVLIADSVGIAVMYALLGRVEPIAEIPQNDTAVQCAQFPFFVRFPVLTTLKRVAQGNPLTEMKVSFPPTGPSPLPPGKAQSTVKGHGAFALTLITPIYVDFFERHRLWIKATFGGDAYAWPPIFNFARVLRNFVSHHAGHVHFDNTNAAPVTWHNLTYSPADEGKKVLVADIDVGDLIVLLFEIGDEIDRHNCPLNP